MLSIKKVSIRNAEYYLRLALEYYYQRGGEPPGQWHGRGATLLGLSGDVLTEPFQNLFQGFAPDGSRELVQNAGQKSGYHRRCPGWDLAFSPPKTVSVAWGLGPSEVRRIIEEDHREAVRTALSSMEDFAAVTRRGSGGKRWEMGAFCYALFEHGTSRNQDPQLHTHAICFNLIMRQDGTTGAVRSNSLFDLKMAVGALYRCHLAYALQRDLGLRIEKVESWFEIQGVNPDLADRLSSRRKELLEYCQQRGVSGPIAAEKAALATRQVKGHVAREVLFQQWAQIGQEYGWGQEQVLRLVRPQEHRPEVARQTQPGTPTAANTVSAAVRSPAWIRALEEAAVAGQTAGLTADQVVASVSIPNQHPSKSSRFQDIPNRTLSPVEQSPAQANTKAEVVAPTAPRQGTERLGSRPQDTLSAVQQILAKANTTTHPVRPKAPLQGIGIVESQPQRGLAPDQSELMAWAGSLLDSDEPLDNQVDQFKVKASRGARARSPLVVVRIRDQVPRLGQPILSLDLRFFTLELRRERVFPNAPWWSPLQRVRLPVLVSKINHDPFGLKRRLTIPLDRVRRDTACKIQETIRSALGAGARMLLLNDERFDSLVDTLGRVRTELRRATRPRIVIADTVSQTWRTLLRDWCARGISRPEDVVILTETSHAAEKLNKAAQELRRRSGQIGLTRITVKGVTLSDNDRIIFKTGFRDLVEPHEAGTVTKISKKRIRISLDSGKKLDFPLRKCPSLRLGYAVSHADADKVKPKRALVLFQGNDPEREMASVLEQLGQVRMRIYTDVENAQFVSPDGITKLRHRIGAKQMLARDREAEWQEQHHRERAGSQEEERRRREEQARRLSQQQHDALTHWQTIERSR